MICNDNLVFHELRVHRKGRQSKKWLFSTRSCEQLIETNCFTNLRNQFSDDLLYVLIFQNAAKEILR